MGLPLRATLSAIKPGLGFADLSHPIYNGLIAAYLFNESGGVTLVDSAQPRRATLSGTYNWTETYQGPALNFNGGVAAGQSNALDPFSFAFWANFTTNSPAHQAIVSKSDGGQAFGTLAPGHGWVIENGNSAGVQFNIANSAGVARLSVGSAPALNSWHFYVVFWDQTGNMSFPHAGIFVDGRLVGVSGSAIGTYVSDATEALNIGQYNGATNSCSNAQIACFFAWNRIISQADAQALYVATYPAIPRVYRYPVGALTQSFAATASTKAGTLGRKIFKTIAAAKATFQGALTARFLQFQTLTATAAQKAGSLIASKVLQNTFTATMLQRSGTLGREVFKTIAATKAHYAGALTAVKAATQQTFAATKHTFAGALSTQTGVALKATKAQFQGKLTLVVEHGPQPPSTCTPTACPTVSNVISHVEICENPGS